MIKIRTVHISRRCISFNIAERILPGHYINGNNTYKLQQFALTALSGRYISTPVETPAAKPPLSNFHPGRLSMLTRNRVNLLLSITLVVSLLVLIAATYNIGGTDASAKTMKSKVLRRKDKTKVKPSAEEIAAFQEARPERTFKNRDFKDMPLAITKVSNLQSDTWHKDLGIEVKNVSNKPIYFILAFLDFPDIPVPADGVYGIALEFGQRRNIDYRKDADPHDPHLNPGDKFTFTIPEKMREGLRDQHEKSPELMKKLELHLSVISFGDGTGFVAERLRDRRLKRAHSDVKKNHHSDRSGRPASMPPSPQDGCGTCSRYKIHEELYVICYSGGPCYSSLATDTSPDEPCTLTRPHFFPCGSLQCHHDEIYESSACPGYSPTPTPTPTPSPSPSPTCDPNTRPNNTNCQCTRDINGDPAWACGCADGSEFADYVRYTQNYGCPPNKYNDGECCQCLEVVTCDSGCSWDPYFCRCVDSVGTPCGSPTPGGGGDPGGGSDPNAYSTTYERDCVDYYWVWFVSYDGGHTWYATGQTEYAGCFYMN